MELLTDIFDFIARHYAHDGPAILVPFFILLIIAVAGQWSLYDKAGQPGYACLVPGWNVVAFLKILGRPAWQIIYFLIPVFNIYFTVRCYVELCRCFGKTKISDYVLVIILNGFYVLFLGLSYSINYIGPVYGSPDGKPIPVNIKKKKAVRKAVKRRIRRMRAHTTTSPRRAATA